MSFKNAFVGLAALVLAACGASGEGSVAPSGCTSNADCKGTRVCYHHECVFSEEMDVSQQDAMDEFNVPEVGPDYKGKLLLTCELPKTDNLTSVGIYSMNPDGTEIKELTVKSFVPTQGFIGKSRWSPDLTQIAYGGLELIGIMSVNEENEVTIPVITNKDSFVFNWSPDGQKIILSNQANNSNLYLINVKDHNAAYFKGDENLSHPDWSHQGDKIVYYYRGESNADSTVRYSNLDGSNEVILSTPPDALYPCARPAWSPDDRKILVECYPESGPDLRYWNLDQESYHQVVAPAPSTYHDFPRWSPNGQQVTYIVDNKVRLADVSTGQESLPPNQPQERCYSVDWR
ncbi:MAG: hypothetical protein WCV90_02660 [Candidatus Woesearchaeota archaeon]